MHSFRCARLRPAVLTAFACALLLPSAALARRKSAAQPFGLSPLAAELERTIDADQPDYRLLAAAIFFETNRVRARLGLKAFGWLRELDRAADLQASSTALSQAAGHVHLLPTLATVSDRVEHVGLRARRVGENSALLPVMRFDPDAGYFTRTVDGRRVFFDGRTERALLPHTYASFAAAVLDAWMKSPGHRASIVNPDFEYVGCSGRTTRSIDGLMLLSCIQVFFTPMNPR